MARSKVSQVRNVDKEVFIEVEAERVEMKLNTESSLASGLLIQRLTELYENPIEATVRETVSNALDAVTESCSGKRPTVKIVAPTTLSPILTVTDNGVGMTYEDLKEIYAKYGASTKVDDMNQIGAYGLGAKAPLAYGNEFTVTSIKDGQKTTILVAKEEMTNFIKIVGSEQTDEPSGTKVSIPVSSSDIDRFADYVGNYKENPIDKDVDIYVNGEKSDTSDYILITDELLIEEEEGVQSRIWVNKKNVADFLSQYGNNSSRIANGVEYVIGGWVYKSPAAREYRFGSTANGIIVELKAGIVGFNSSRDAILENDRYEALQAMVMKYIQSDKFFQDMTESIKELGLEDFKRFSTVLLSTGEVEITKNGLKLTRENPFSASKTTINYKEYRHNETDFSLNDLLLDTPKTTKPTAVFTEYKAVWRKTNEVGLMRSTQDFRRTPFATHSIGEINGFITEVFEGGKVGHNLLGLMLTLFNEVYAETKSKVLIVTDVDKETVKKLKPARKTLVEARGNGATPVVIVYTGHTYAEVDKMIDGNLDVEIQNVEDTLEKIKELRAEKRASKPAKEKREGISTDFYTINLEEGYYKSVSPNDIEADEDNLIIITRYNRLSVKEVAMVLNWYENTNGKAPKNFYLSSGKLLASDVDKLIELGDVYRDPTSEPVGLSKAYQEKLHDKVASFHSTSDKILDRQEIVVMRLVAGLMNTRPSQIVERVIEVVKAANEFCEIVKKDEIEFDVSKLTKYVEDTNETFKELLDGSYRAWDLDSEALSHLYEKLDDENRTSAQALCLLNGTVIKVTKCEDNTVRIHKDWHASSPRPNQTLHTMKTLMEDGGPMFDFEKANVENYVDFISALVSKVQ